MPGSTEPPMAGVTPRLLIVDDVADNRIVLRRRFEKRGFEIAEADGGLAALARIAEEKFDLVLLDIVMLDIDGLETLRQIRASHSLAQLPVIMVTAKAETKDVVEALAHGANDYITKPVDFPIALARVQTQIARRQAEHDLQRINDELSTTNRRLELEIAERMKSQAQIQHMAHHDALTGLGNRVLFREQSPVHSPASSGTAAASPCCVSTSTSSKPSTTRSGRRSGMRC